MKPEYLFQPLRVVKRVCFVPSDQLTLLDLSCGPTIYARTNDEIGRAIAVHGVYDLTLTEAIVRLTEPGDSTLDIGGNIGYTALLFARAAGPTGTVMVFEPNPEVIPILRANTRHWIGLPKAAAIKIETAALADKNGNAVLSFPKDYEVKSGGASLEISTDRGVSVRTLRLDSLNLKQVNIIKIDVEGHEAKVFAGGEELLSMRPPRDIIFEEHRPYPAPSHLALERHGYQVFRITRSLWRPLLRPAEETAQHPRYMPSNFLATMNAGRAKNLFAVAGWRALYRRS